MARRSSISSFSKIIAFILLLIIPFVYYGDLFRASTAKNIINRYNEERFKDFYAAGSLDMIFVGSSHSYCAFDPEIFDSKLGTSSFQLGMPQQLPDATYYTLLEVLNYQKPKTVVMELYWGMLSDKFNQKQAEMLFKVLKNKELEQDYFNKVYPVSEKVKYFIEPIRFSQDYLAMKNKELEAYVEETFDVVKEKQEDFGTEYYRSKGYVYCTYVINEDKLDRTNQFKHFDGKSFEIDNTQKKYIEKIVRLCEQNDIELIFVTAPIAPVSMEKIKNYDFINKKVGDLCQQLNTPYFDYNIINADEKILENKNFRDDAHLNDSGVIILCEHFIGLTKDFLIPTKTLDIEN